REAAFRLYQGHAVHDVGDVVGDHRRGAVVDVQARVDGFEAEPCLGARKRLGRDRSPTRTGYRMQVYRVNELAVGGVLQHDVDGVSEFHADERAGDESVERPETIGSAVGQERDRKSTTSEVQAREN